MSMGFVGKATNARNKVVAVQAQAERLSMFGEMTGTIVAFDAQKQTATIQPDYKKSHRGRLIDLPELLDVPVRFPKAGGFVLTLPVKAGDKVALRPQMRSSERFHTGGEYTATDDARSMALSDMEAFLDGGEPLTAPISGFNTDSVELRTAGGDYKIAIKQGGDTTVQAARMVIKAGSDVLIEARGNADLRSSADVSISGANITFDTAGKLGMPGSQGDVLSLLARVVELLSIDGLDVRRGSSVGNVHALENRDEYAEIAAKLKAMVR